MPFRALAVLLCVAVCFALAGEAFAQRRVALVIGNSDYRETPRLLNPANDARDMDAMLSRIGFEVTRLLDADRAALERGIRDFGRRATGADLALVFYAGHGLQVDGQNWLLPVDARLEQVVDLEFEAVNLDTVMRAIGGATRRVFLLDACRDNPLLNRMAAPGRGRSIGRGLAPIETRDAGALIVFATSPGEIASDGSGRNSPFTQALLQHLPAPGLEISQLMTRVRQSVLQTTGGRQLPWEHSSLTEALVLNAATSPARPAAEGDPVASERLAWEVIAGLPDGAGKRAAVESFLAAYPQGAYAGAARVLLAALEAGQPAAVAAVEAPARAQPPAPAAPPAPASEQTAALQPGSRWGLVRHWSNGAACADIRVQEVVAEGEGLLVRARHNVDGPIEFRVSAEPGGTSGLASGRIGSFSYRGGPDGEELVLSGTLVGSSLLTYYSEWERPCRFEMRFARQ